MFTVEKMTIDERRRYLRRMKKRYVAAKRQDLFDRVKTLCESTQASLKARMATKRRVELVRVVTK